MKQVAVGELSTIAMVSGNERLYRVIIDSGMVKEWVGIGWIELREATPQDKEKYPTVKRPSE